MCLKVLVKVIEKIFDCVKFLNKRIAFIFVTNQKSFYRRAVDYLQAPPERQVKGFAYNQSTNSALDSAVFGYNTTSGSIPQKLLEDIGEGTGNSAVVACLNVLATSYAEPQLKVYKKDIGETTVTALKKLSNEERVLEIAQMLGGKEVSDSAVAHAQQLLN